MEHRSQRRSAFTLIELLTVVAIISLLISILMPSLSRARDQAKGVHCLARLKDFGSALAAYENVYGERLPPALYAKPNAQDPDAATNPYGWTELLYIFVYKEPVEIAQPFPAMRNLTEERFRFEPYFLCKASSYDKVSSGHYRVYLPAWAAGTYQILPDGTFGVDTQPSLCASISRSTIRPKMPLIGDSNERSYRGAEETPPEQMTSSIGPGEANDAGPNGFDGNRFSDRHYGGTNFLFQDLHASWEPRLRDDLARDWDLNGIDDIEILP